MIFVYGSDRFSEDIDLDNYGLNKENFEDLIYIVKNELQKEGIKIEIRNTFKGVYHCYIKFPEILFNNRLSPLKDEKILIQIDSFALKSKASSKTFVLSKFDVFTEIRTCLFTSALLKDLARDVEPFLIDPKKTKQVALFNEWLKNI